ncbi:Zinc knuckle [Popillia japonica]|uniref:Zinc knuckle n=1 Tax=Popillia japonica TaxID=7064 RepID=A0AAW1KMA3_POPJA
MGKYTNRKTNLRSSNCKTFNRLPEKYKYFRSAWESIPTEKQTLDHLTARLLIEEERLGKEQGETVALMSRKHEIKCYKCGKTGHVKSQCKKKIIECYYCKKKGHVMKDCFYGNTGHVKSQCKKKTIECYYCKKKGHVMKDCFYKNQRNGRDNKSEQYNKNNSVALVAISNEIELDRELFDNFEMLKEIKNIKIGDGTTMKAIGTGSINVSAYNGQDFHDVTLYDVLYVPKLEVNLFSQCSALDKGLTLMSNSKNAKLVNKNNETCAMASRSGKLFKMLFKIKNDSSESCLKAEDSQDLMWWHRVLAHQNFRHVTMKRH